MIQYGDADAVVCGRRRGDADRFGFACFNSMQALSPTGISRPFDARRDGFVMGEGAGVLVLEEAPAAAARGATRARRAAPATASTSDAYHLTAPEPDGRPRVARRSSWRIADAGVDRRRGRLHQRARHLDPAQRRGRDGGAQARARRATRNGSRSPRPSPRSAICSARPGAVEAVATVHDPDHRRDPADARLRGARPRPRSRLRARRGPAAAARKRTAADGDLELVRASAATTSRWCPRSGSMSATRSSRRRGRASTRSSGSRRCAIRARCSVLRSRRPLARLGDRARRRRRRARRDRRRRRAADRLLRAGRLVPRRFAGRAPRRHDRARARDRRAGADARRRVRRVRRRPDAGGHAALGRLRPDLPPDGRADRAGARRSRSSPAPRPAAAPTRRR